MRRQHLPRRLRRRVHLLRTPDPLPLIAFGLAVFPLPPGGRMPGRRGWARDCLRTADEVRARWRPGDNIGVGCWASRLVGLDLDVHGGIDGRQLFERLCASQGEPWPETFTVATPSAGRHLYFRAPENVVIGSVSGGRSALGPGIDVRGPGRGGRGGYLIGPTSVVGDRTYTVERDLPVVTLPGWLMRLLSEPPADTRTEPSTTPAPTS
jgi:Bifunctional DNA primase/polymerase, N-terminal